MIVSDPNGIRTRVTPVKGECPRPLDDRVVRESGIWQEGGRAQGKKRRTPGPVLNLFKKIFKTVCIDSVYFKKRLCSRSGSGSEENGT